MLVALVRKGEDEQRNKTVAANDDCGQDTARSHMRLKDGVALESGPGVQSLIDQQQNEVLHLCLNV